eukprot:CAMPEP_0194330684 /NCGR_PEP_ID=MMETSP0171-20130528/52888_1 /TAXON_ID=218684 /ORGANISM="Corethron pennatum, Strain L29A3" /LENGTH=30 /DNA_ID= /DNA_START= /DNA_END= /DNA_ORIENTATION=
MTQCFSGLLRSSGAALNALHSALLERFPSS